MFKFFSRSKSSSEEENRRGAYDPAKLKMLVSYFPIGKKLRYYPEYQREIVFHTIVIAYRVNEQFIYSRDAVQVDADGVPTGFVLPDTKTLPVEKLTKFQLLVPDTTEMERTLDYFTRAELGRAGQFRQGNTITLVAETGDRGIPTVDNKVDRRQIMKVGPYADSSTILLTPEFHSLTIADKRQKQRVQAAIRADLYYVVDTPPLRCVLADFSEVSLRLNVPAGGQAMPALVPDETVVVDFDFGDIASTYRIRGKLFRRADDYCVIKIEQLYKDGEFERIKMMDIIEIKTGLLNLKT